MTKNTTFKEYLENHPFGNYELYTQAMKKILVAEWDANNPRKEAKPFCGAFTVWTEATQPQEKTTVYQVAKKLQKSTDELLHIMEDKFNIFASKHSHVENYILIELF